MKERRDFDRMFTEWYRPFFYFAYNYVKDEEVCRDLVSETFEYLWLHYEHITEETAKSYLLSLLRNKCVDHLRRLDIHSNYIRYVEQINETYFHEGGIEEADQRVALIRKSMERLTPYNRHILKECYIHRKKYKEVAEDLGVSVAAIHKNLVKALRILRKELKNR